nr:TetR/AcrR family transcriptional regulator [Rhodococcus wratislaviensis]GLK34142.1 putative transcriptional regulator, TetR family protein [Rhodococcus wratislaviensis]
MTGEAGTREAVVHPRVGRPRDSSLEERLLRAAREELTDRGVAGFSMRSVAKRAGVARSSLLLRWTEAEALIVDAIDAIVLPEIPELPGTLRGDLLVLLGAIADQMGTEAMDLQMRVMADASSNPGLLARFQERLLHPTARRFTEVLQAAVDRGELAADVDRALLADSLVGVVYIRTMASPKRRPPGAQARRTLIDRMLRMVQR